MGVTSRLIGLVMLPVTVMSVLAGSVVYSHRSLAADAVAVDEAVNNLSQLIALRNALLVEESVESFDIRFAELDVTRDAVSEFLGVDLTAQVATARADAHRAVESLGQHSLVGAIELDALYAEIDRDEISSTSTVRRLDGYRNVVADAANRGLDRLEAEARSAPLVAALNSLRVATDLIEVATHQGIAVSAIWFPSPIATQQHAATGLAHFAIDSAEYLRSIDRLRELGVESVVGSVDRIAADPRFEAFDLAVATQLRGESPAVLGAPVDEAKIVAIFRGFLVRDDLLRDVLMTATEAVRDQARRLAAAETATFRIWAFGTAVLVVASIGVALWFARSISRPLRDLAGYAHAVNDGELDAEPAGSRNHGPRETQAAFEVFTDLVVNLQLLDSKANALANCDFDDPILRVPFPGRLGLSLESSVALLSGSIVERDQLQVHLAHQATHDSLTGISNRPAAMTALEAAMHRAVRTGAPIALLFIDLNDFKAVNDSHGHEVGDEVLRQVANRLSTELRRSDFVARLGGDEFVVVAEAIADATEVTDLARRVIDTISRPIDVDGTLIIIGAAIGIAITLDGPEEPLRLLARADAAMYRAKFHKQSAIEIFDADLQRQMIEREDVETALTAALADPAGGGLQLHYQPVMAATSGALVGVEALIRWDRPGHGLLPPDSFIPIAEATALVIEVDRWVLGEATRQLLEWSSVPELAEVPVAVNISGRHLLSRLLPGNIREVLEATGIDPSRLSVEITETVLLSDLVAAGAELDTIRALGVKVAIDDFGTGYTSLAHLQHLPIDTIKIDRSFISQLNVRRGSSLVRMVTDLGHAIDINIVAEGVETEAEMSALQAMGADHLQGFLLSRPLTPSQLSLWACERSADRVDALLS